MSTKRKLAALPVGVLAVLIALISGQAQAAESLKEMFTQGKGGLSLRYRLENVDQDNFAKDAVASTIRARLNFKTADWNGWGLFAEYDFVQTIGWDDYNAGAGNTPDRGQYPVVADPTGMDLNQVYVSWKPAAGSEFRAGRQRIIYDNARFVGNVGWRQNPQTYDGVSYRFKNEAGVDLQVAYIGHVNRIFGRDVAAGDQSVDIFTGNASKNLQGVGKLTAYIYDIDNEDSAAFSTTTYGLRLNGKHKTGSTTLGYTVEYAHQNETANNPVDYSANYWRFDLSATFGAVTPYIAYESLGGDVTRGGAMFRTPLATLHAFNGWADKFLATPGAGLSDAMIGVKGKLGSWNWNVVYHDFEAESGNAKFGNELDASLATKFSKHYGVLFKAASFNADSSSSGVDTVKLWVQLTANF
jgi:hypothetical protein